MPYRIDQRTTSTCIFGATCPGLGEHADLVCSFATINLHLADISTGVAPGANAKLLIDENRLHLSDWLVVPTGITLNSLSAKRPELTPVENIWQFAHDIWLSNRIFNSAHNIIDHCCYAWNKFFDRPWRIVSIRLREWAHAF